MISTGCLLSPEGRLRNRLPGRFKRVCSLRTQAKEDGGAIEKTNHHRMVSIVILASVCASLVFPAAPSTATQSPAAQSPGPAPARILAGGRSHVASEIRRV